MKNSLKMKMAILVICFTVLCGGWQYLKIVFAHTVDYTEKDKFDYHFYTPQLLQNVPRVSNNTTFHYSNVSGPNPALIHQIIFYGTTDISSIVAYLEKNGYIKEGLCYTQGECWAGNDPDITLSISIEEDPALIRLEMIDKTR